MKHQWLLCSKSLLGHLCPANAASWQGTCVCLSLAHPHQHHVLSGHWSGTPVCFIAAGPEQGSAAAFSKPLLGSSEISCFWLVQSFHPPIHQAMPADTGVQSPGVVMRLGWAPGKVCPAVSCLPVSVWLGGLLALTYRGGWVDTVVPAAPRELWGSAGRVGLHRAPPVWEGWCDELPLHSLPASPQGNTAQSGRNCNPAPGRKAQDSDTDAYQLVNPPPASQTAAVWAEMGTCPMECSSTGAELPPAPFPAAAPVLPVTLNLLTWPHVLGRVWMSESICILMLNPESSCTEAEGRGVGLDVSIWGPPKPVLLLGLDPYLHQLWGCWSWAQAGCLLHM